MKRWTMILVAFLSAALLVGYVLGCGGDDDDDDDDDGASYGSDIEGFYPVNMLINEDTCQPTNVGAEEEWGVTIEQDDDFGWATVYWQEAGVGSEQIELFSAKVYGTVIVDAGVEEFPQGDSACVKFKVKNYYIYIDTVEGTLSGRLTDDIFYQGQGCDSSSINCRFERVLEPQNSSDD